jgi:hypothetical protein
MSGIRTRTALVLILIVTTGCSLLFPSKTDIKGFDRDYLKDKYVGKTGRAAINFEGIKQGEAVRIQGIDFDVRTVVNVRAGSIDHYFIIYSNKDLANNKNNERNVAYEISQIEREINNRIDFLAP